MATAKPDQPAPPVHLWYLLRNTLGVISTAAGQTAIAANDQSISKTEQGVAAMRALLEKSEAILAALKEEKDPPKTEPSVA